MNSSKNIYKLNEIKEGSNNSLIGTSSVLINKSKKPCNSNHNIAKILISIFTLSFISSTSRINSQQIITERNLNENSNINCVERLTQSLNNYTLVLDTYDEVSLLQLFLYNEDIIKTKECFDAGENWLEFNSVTSNLKSNVSNYNNKSTFKTLKNTEYLLIIAEFTKEMLTNCTHYETFYLAATDCQVDFNFIINSKQIIKSLYIRFIEKISNTKIPLETSSFLYAYEYNNKEANVKLNTYKSSYEIPNSNFNSEVNISPIKFSNYTNFIKCDTIECLQNNEIFGNYDFKTVYFKITNEVELDLIYNIKLEKVIMVVNDYQYSNSVNLEYNEANQNENKEFLSNTILNNTENNYNDNSLRSQAVFFKDITHLVEQVKNFYAIKLKFYPEKFNLILTFNLKKNNPSKTEEKMIYRVNDFMPFSKLKLLSTVSPNFKILLYTVAAILFLVLLAILVVCLKCICRK